jgi:hypothetical protein
VYSKPLSAALVVLCLGAAARVSEAADGVQIVQRVTSGANPTTTQTQVEATRLRTELTDQNGLAQIVIFDGQKQVLYIVDAAKKSYFEMTKADLDRLQAQMQGMMAQMQAALEKMPPAQRAQMEALMKGRMGGIAATAPKIESKRVGTDKVGRWTCDKYEVLMNGEKTSDVCTVDPSALGFTAKDFEVSRQLASFFSALVPQMAAQVAVVGRVEAQGFAGFPVRSTVTVAGRTVTTEVVEASRQTFPDSLFAVPAGFTKQSPPGIGAIGAPGAPAR